MVGKATPNRRGPREPPMEWTPASGEQERHNVTVINDGVKILQFMFGLQLPLTCNPWTTLSNRYNKVRGKILLKKSSCVFLPASLSFMRRLLLRPCPCVCLNYCVVMLRHMSIQQWVCVHVSACVRNCASVFVCEWVLVYSHVCVNVWVIAWLCVSVNVCTRVRNTCLCVSVYVCGCACAYERVGNNLSFIHASSYGF